MHSPDEAAASSSDAAAVRFGMPQALVLVAFLAAAVILSLVAHMSVRDVAILLGAAGGVGVAVVASTTMKGGGGGGVRLLKRLLSAAVNNGSGS